MREELSRRSKRAALSPRWLPDGLTGLVYVADHAADVDARQRAVEGQSFVESRLDDGAAGLVYETGLVACAHVCQAPDERPRVFPLWRDDHSTHSIYVAEFFRDRVTRIFIELARRLFVLINRHFGRR